jgi:hypothetical protein
MLQVRGERRPHSRIVSHPQCIAHRHRNITQPPLVPDAANGAAFGAAQKFFSAPGEQFDKR